jgi:hypothetical protein
MGEDKLAIYTVASAALKVLRDLMKRRGRTFVEDRWLYIMVALARESLEGNPSKPLHYFQKHDPAGYRSNTADGQHHPGARERKGSRIRADELMRVTASEGLEFDYAKRVDWPANFLKHADNDPEGHLDDDEFRADEVTFDACDAYLSLMHSVTPEMLLYLTLRQIEHGMNVEALFFPCNAVGRLLQRFDRSEWRRVCLQMLDQQRNTLNDWLRVSSAGDNPEV